MAEYLPEGKATKWSLLAAYNPDSAELNKIEEVYMEDTTKGLLVANYVWSYDDLEWVKATQTTLTTDILYLALDNVEDKLDSIIAAVEIMDDWDSSNRASVSPISGQVGVQGGEGAINALTQRVTIATDDDGVAHLATLAGAVTGTSFSTTVAATPTVADATNSTQATLGIGASWTGTSIDILKYSAVTVFNISDVASAADGMTVSFSADDTNWDEAHGHTAEAGTPHVLTIPVQAQYMRVSYTNGGTGQAYFRLYTYLHPIPPGTHIERVDGDVDGDTLAAVGKSILAAKKPDNSYTNIDCTAGGNLKTSIQEISDGLDIGAGNAGSETARVSISTDDVNLSAIKTAIEIMDDWDETNRAAVNLIASQVGVQGGEGAATALTLRVTGASDDTNWRAIKTAVEVMDDWDLNDRCRVSPISGQDGVAANSGAVGATTQRMILATDDPAVASLAIMDDWDESDRAKVNLIVGQAGIAAGAGAVGVTVPRVTLASDDPLLAEVQDSYQDYFLGAWLVDGTNVYVGKVDKAGAFIIIKHDTSATTVTYDVGTGGLPASGTWAARSYQAFNTEV